MLIVLIKSARNIVRYMSLEEKESVMTRLGPKFQALVEKDESEALRIETTNLLKELGLYNLPYEELNDIYLNQRISNNDPTLFRSLILKDNRDKLADLWLAMLDVYESATGTEKQWFDQEFALLR